MIAGNPTLLTYLIINVVYIRDAEVSPYEMTVLLLIVFILCAIVSIYFCFCY